VIYPLDSSKIAAFPMEPQAVVEAIRWTTIHAPEYNGDAANIQLLGGSAGGNLVLLAAQTVNAETPGLVKSIMALSPPTNLVTLRAYEEQRKAEGLSAPGMTYIPMALGCGTFPNCTESQEQEWTPVFHPSCTQTYLAGGEREVIIPISQPKELISTLESSGCPVKLRQVSTSAHAFGYRSRIRTEIISFVRNN
jgi:acetyl esterase/lipase